MHTVINRKNLDTSHTSLDFILLSAYMSDSAAMTSTVIDGEVSSDDHASAGQKPLISGSSYQERIILPTKKNTSGLLLIEQ